MENMDCESQTKKFFWKTSKISQSVQDRGPVTLQLEIETLSIFS